MCEGKDEVSEAHVLHFTLEKKLGFSLHYVSSLWATETVRVSESGSLRVSVHGDRPRFPVSSPWFLFVLNEVWSGKQMMRRVSFLLFDQQQQKGSSAKTR